MPENLTGREAIIAAARDRLAIDLRIQFDEASPEKQYQIAKQLVAMAASLPDELTQEHLDAMTDAGMRFIAVIDRMNAAFADVGVAMMNSLVASIQPLTPILNTFAAEVDFQRRYERQRMRKRRRVRTA